MKLFSCPACGNTLYFHNVTCGQCGHILGFIPDTLTLAAFEVVENHTWYSVDPNETRRFRPCSNYLEHDVCNWVIPADAADPFCASCRLNRTIPDLSVAGNKALWHSLQMEKHRLIYSLLRLRLPLITKQDSPEQGLAFDFIGDPNPRFQEDSGVMTGHANGLITIDLAEADDAVREKVRQEMAEPYRTLLGHFRHESGHYYWDRLVRPSEWLAPFRQRFGDERLDYDQALNNHYANGAPPDWWEHYVSRYASSHPWEDWAESWAHYLHMVDTLETAWQLGLRLAPRVAHDAEIATAATFDPYGCADFESLRAAWLPLTMGLNSLSRSMGQPDAYPFVLTPPILEKLKLVHDIVHSPSSLP